MLYTEPHKSQMLETLESLIAINQKTINSHEKIIEALNRENEETRKKIERIRIDE